MKRTLLTAAFAALALSAAQAVSVQWTSTDTNNKTLNLTNGRRPHLHACHVQCQSLLHLHGGRRVALHLLGS